jgi:hydroxymethylpyrimidine/phosphomethylpyrimidine kinase
MQSKEVLSFPTTLSIAGSDCSGGAGIQADLKAFSHFQTYGTSVITCVVAEHPKRVKSIHPVPVKTVRDQIDMVFEAFPIKTAKTGMLYSDSIIESVASGLKQRRGLKLIVDPVMISTSGTLLLKKKSIYSLCDQIFPMATLVTPNLNEASFLVGKTISSEDDLITSAISCQNKWGVPFLVKGGHLKSKEAIDVFADGKSIYIFSKKRIYGIQTHGTGCTYSASICALLAKGCPLIESINKAKEFLTKSISKHIQAGNHKVLNHFLP